MKILINCWLVFLSFLLSCAFCLILFFSLVSFLFHFGNFPQISSEPVCYFLSLFDCVFLNLLEDMCAHWREMGMGGSEKGSPAFCALGDGHITIPSYLYFLSEFWTTSLHIWHVFQAPGWVQGTTRLAIWDLITLTITLIVGPLYPFCCCCCRAY